MTSVNAALMERARQLLPGGVSSPVRAFRAIGGDAPVMISARGASIYDADGNDYVDFTLAYGPHILGHGHPAVVDAIAQQLDRGIAFGATSDLEIELAHRIVDAVASVEMVRFVNSGTEATMSAIRLARAATGRDVVIKFAGGYHGHSDALLAEAGSGVATLAIAGSPGVPAAAVADTAVVPYNDDAAVEAVMTQRQIACVIVEPVAGNMGCVPPAPGFLQRLRDLCTQHAAVLIFDEVMTGFRVAYGGAQELYGVTPDLTCLGKVIGAGLPVAAYGGRRDLMEQMAPGGPVYQAGTLSGNALAMAAGIAVLDELADGSAYTHLERLGQRLETGLAAALGWPSVVNRVGSMLTPFVGTSAVTDFGTAQQADREGFARLCRSLHSSGIFWPPSQFEAGFLCTAHTEAQIDAVIEAATAVPASL